MTSSARQLAVEVLERVEAGAFSHILLPATLGRSSLSERDRGFVTEHVYGTLRWQRRLDHQIGLVSTRPVDQLDVSVRAALRLGAHQLFVGVPAHAAVSETVDLVARRARGFVNAVLRRIADVGLPWPRPTGLDTTAALGVVTSHPDWIVRRLVEQWGSEQARLVLDADNEPPAVTLRVRSGSESLGSAEAIAEVLRARHGATVEKGRVVPGALLVGGGGNPGEWEPVRDGRATVQDQSSQAVVDVLDPRPGMCLVDVAAAPGGKATAAAERVGPSGAVVAADISLGRLQRVREAARRIGLGSVVSEVVADGRRLGIRPGVDSVLVDAPCSGLGVLRRRPEARWRIGSDDPAQLAAQQRDLLAEAATLVRPGGTLVYSVCTWTVEETVEVARWASENLGGFAAEPLGRPWAQRGAGGQLMPSDGCDGMFVLRFRRGR